MVKTFTVLKTFKTSKVIQYKYYETFEHLQADKVYHIGQRWRAYLSEEPEFTPGF